jgi:hypothetical protein
VWERETILSTEARWMTVVEAGCSRGVVFKLARFWPASGGIGHNKIEAKEETPIDCIDGATEERICTSGAAGGEVVDG